MPSTHGQDMERWRILLLGREGAELLLFRNATGLCLPELQITRWQRPAALLNAEAERLWGVKTVCVSPLAISGTAHREGEKYYVMELLHPDELARIAPNLVEFSTVKVNSFVRASDYAAILQVMGEKTNSESDDPCGHFVGLGSFRRISSWVDHQLNRIGLRWDGSIRQLHADASFALIRFSTSQGAVWFKAVGEPNLREVPVTQVLAARFPRHVPQTLAVHSEWHAWLTREAEGQELCSSTTPEEWLRAAQSLAELQVASIQHVPDILAAGAHDVRSYQLMELVGPFFCAMEHMMEAQTKTGPRKLSRHEIAKVLNQVTDVLRQWDDAGIPETLNHVDLNPDNVFAAPKQCTFLDWAEAAVGNPFLSFEYLRQHFLRKFPCAPEIDRQFRDSYVKSWTQVLPDRAVEKALHLAPLVAVFAYASALPWNDSTANRKSHLAGYLRSMVRRMHHECELLESRAV